MKLTRWGGFVFVSLALMFVTACAREQKVTYEISGTAQNALVEYTDVTGKKIQETVSLPWTLSFSVKKSFAFELYAMNSGSDGSIHCEVFVSGESVGDSTASQYVGCAGSFSQNGDTLSTQFKGYQDIFPQTSGLPTPTAEAVSTSAPAESSNLILYLAQSIQDPNFTAFLLHDLQSNDTRQLTTYIGPVQCYAKAPGDLRFVLSIQRKGFLPDLYMMDLGEGKDHTPINLTNTPERGEHCPDWSPDGAKIIFPVYESASKQSPPRAQIASINPDGSGFAQITNLAETSAAYFPVFSHDGTKIAFVMHDTDILSIASINADGSNFTKLTSEVKDTVMGAINNNTLSKPAWSPDDQRIAYFYREGIAGSLFLVDVNGGAVEGPFISDFQNRSAPVWSSDGKTILYHGTIAPNGPAAILSQSIEDGTQQIVNAGIGTANQIYPVYITDGSIKELILQPIEIPSFK